MPSITPSERLLKVRLKQLRLKAGLTQEAFSELSGIAYKYYQHLESGRMSNLRLRTVDKIAAAYGLTLDQFFGKEIPTPKLPAKAIPSPHNKKRVAKKSSSTTAK